MIQYRRLGISDRRVAQLRKTLDPLVVKYNSPSFIANDPISIPHLFTKKQDIEIAGFFSAILAWGQRKTIINKARQLMELMDMAPHDFIMSHKARSRRRFKDFVHRTFQYDDLLHFLNFLQDYYRCHDSLEDAFIPNKMDVHEPEHTLELGLLQFKELFFKGEHLPRTRKHISSPKTNAACKRLVMFLRWMVRKDSNDVDFGIWNRVDQSQLYVPLDVHVFKVAKQMQLTDYSSPSWKAVKQITDILRRLDPNDPAKYDFALFNIGLLED